MKQLLTLLLALTAINVRANNYYLATEGRDINNGLTPNSAWQTIEKLNSAFSTFSAGDSILFKRGETFYGSITISKSGTDGKPITICAYGKGLRPTITGFTIITGWTKEEAGIYSKPILSVAMTNMVIIGGMQAAMGRYPDTSYLSYESFGTNVSITDSQLTSNPDWTGAEAVIRKNDWTIDRCHIRSHYSNTLTYTSFGTSQNAIANFGYFIQNDLRTLTTYGEWYHNINNGKFYIYFGTVDTSKKVVQVATVNNLFTNAGFRYITIDDLNFTGSIDNAINFTGITDYCNIKNCKISFAGKNGINIIAGAGEVISNNNLQKINGRGISTDGTHTTIINNSLSDIGLLAGQVLGAGGCDGIYSPGNDVIIRNNTLKRIGATGIVIKYLGASTVQYNLIDSACMVFDDGAGIYTSGPDAQARLIDHNIILNTVGNSDGTADKRPLSSGIYLDELASNITVSNNTIANIPYAAIKFHKAHDNIITGNTTFNNLYGIGFFNSSGSNIRNVTLKKNIFFAKTNTQFALIFQSVSNDVDLFGTADSNYYTRPIKDSLVFIIAQPSTGIVYKSLMGIPVFAGKDKNSKKLPKTLTDINEIRFEYNATEIAKTVGLDAPYIGIDNTLYKNAIILQPYTSAILLKSAGKNYNQ